MKNKRTLMIVGGIMGLAALCCVGVIIFGYFYNEGSPSESRNLADLKTVCDGEVVAETTTYDPNISGEHPAAIVEYLGGSESIFLTSGWQYHPNNLEEAELVVCLQDVVDTEIETCEYTLEGDAGDATITRVARVADYRLITTQTGEVVAEGTVKAQPRECQDEETFQDNASFTLRGDFGEALEALIGQHVNTP
ncbi:MAG: hypothetical protein H6657_29740 [Ardenticatenaceae bacterium]|nr:hypothetical protein [Ardenticatenaceae bacterium]